MSKEPQLYKFKDIEHRLHTLEPGKVLHKTICYKQSK